MMLSGVVVWLKDEVTSAQAAVNEDVIVQSLIMGRRDDEDAAHVNEWSVISICERKQQKCSFILIHAAAAGCMFHALFMTELHLEKKHLTLFLKSDTNTFIKLLPLGCKNLWGLFK
ncbi:hypothetical protein ATANTOWER_015034 [Ataeniobius toweri]|uniref:Uncharacterized protein n=1 Tax=Ataeniobius toweri TaxID=208326 RepID=A0ABU7BG34_9TELE|nr:hypothetical protein [Ataeniobius toweri]